MERLPQISYKDMTLEQQNLHDEILSGPRTHIAGPMHAWFLSPTYGSLIQKVGAFCRYKTSLEPRLSELSIIIVARHWNADVEWFAHSKIALENGIDQATIDAIRQRKRPRFERKDESLIFDITDCILKTKRLTDDLFELAVNKLGKKSLLELTAIIGYYCNISIQLNVFQIPTEDGKTLETK